jgi:hypothetical protein
MSEIKPVTPVGATEILAAWEGPAIHELGVLFEEKLGGRQAAEGDIAALAGWIAVTVLSGGTDAAASEALKEKVLGVLAGWRGRYGQAKLDEVKQQVFQDMQKHRRHRQITDATLRERIEKLFGEVPT